VRRKARRSRGLTKGHTVEPGDRLGALLVSIDLSILGAAPEAYDRYTRQIRQEYAFAPDDLYRTGRTAVMRRFLEARAIFPDPALSHRFEAVARENIRREISRLETASP
jgi:predicted metal-dependent HD superfamily phosphohydrolase